MNTVKMAWRNIWRNKRRSLVTIGAMTLALFTMIQYSGLFYGYLMGMERNILDLEMGDIQIFATDYRKHPSIYKKIDNPQSLINTITSRYPALNASGRLIGSGLAASSHTSAAVIFQGIDPQTNAQVSTIHKHLEKGTWLSPTVPKQVVIGKRLAHTLAVEPGDELILLSQASDGSTANDLYIISGILKSIGERVDRGGVFMMEDAYRELMAVDSGVHQVIIRNHSTQSVESLAKEVTQMAPAHDVKSWRALNPGLANMLESSKGAMFTMFIIIYMAIGIVILNAMLMAVFERIREFGILKALGTGPGGVLKLIFLESAMQTFVAICAAGVLSIPMTWYLVTQGMDLSGLGDISISGIAWDPVWKADFGIHTVVPPIGTMVSVVLVAVLYPALKAAFVKPITAITHR